MMSLGTTSSLAEQFRPVRDYTQQIASALTEEDQCAQSMPDASPAKWHRAHTTWFFEQFVLAAHRRPAHGLDVAAGALAQMAKRLQHSRPGLAVHPVVAELSNRLPCRAMFWTDAEQLFSLDLLQARIP